ncbi:hypothetical protein HK097_008130 [Rhizophlyctis rosea]|uniref:Fe2OG dioxygenase domain-containing protein n=1 Tax=Rhizophlyctis rosea TaxID=64517 RepID=A0AAD5SK37_9FUNG|nr:hypothetical protein HK097_008130 [Rhizophlyctis rosea]
MSKRTRKASESSANANPHSSTKRQKPSIPQKTKRMGFLKQPSDLAATYLLPSSTVIDFYPSFLTAEESAALYNALTSAPHPPYSLISPIPTNTTFQWTTASYKIFGKDILAPRLLSGFSDDQDVKDVYNITSVFPWTPEVRKVKEKIERDLGITIRYAQANWYRDGKDSIGFHTDSETREGDCVVSLSLGVKRVFRLRHKRYKEVGDELIESDDEDDEDGSGSRNGAGEVGDDSFSGLPIRKLTTTRVEFDLVPGSLLIMRGDCQKHWKHAVPKEKNVNEGRINITFREF